MHPSIPISLAMTIPGVFVLVSAMLIQKVPVPVVAMLVHNSPAPARATRVQGDLRVPAPAIRIQQIAMSIPTMPMQRVWS